MALFDIAHISDKQKARFWEHVDISGGNDCWPWKMGTSKEGYGKVSFYVLGVKYHLYSHRVALMLTEDRPSRMVPSLLRQSSVLQSETPPMGRRDG
jgi:hypothetical protein